MADRSAGISGFGIATATAGALLVYAGIRNVTPLQALREAVGAGRLPGGSSSTSGAVEKAEQALQQPPGAYVGSGIIAVGSGPFPQLVQAVQPFMSDQYSQARRWQDGYSDCSSFIGKGLKRLGIDPGISTTISMLADKRWKRIPRESAGAGDIAINQAHVVLFTAPNRAVGQENPSRDVQSGTPEELMTGSGSWVVMRWAGPRPGTGLGTIAQKVG